MQENKNKTIYVAILVLCAWIGGLFVGQKNTLQAKVSTSDTVIVVTHDTIYSYEPFEVTRCIYTTHIDTLRTIDSIPIAVEVPIESAQFSDTITTLNDTISYNAFVSGYKPKLDSLQLFHNTYECTIIQTIPQKQKRWHWGITSGYFVGYDISNKRMSNGVGICVGETVH